MKKCPYCAEEIQDEAIVCRYCGRDLGALQAAPPPGLSDHAAAVEQSDEPYPGGAALGAAICTLLAPFIALIVALVMRASETRPKRRAFLQTWAIASGAWLVTGWLVGVLLLTSFSAGAGGCKGGIDEFGPPVRLTSSDGVHWMGTYNCVGGGSTTSPAPPGSVP